MSLLDINTELVNKTTGINLSKGLFINFKVMGVPWMKKKKKNIPNGLDLD
jgi:hypothetical protein